MGIFNRVFSIVQSLKGSGMQNYKTKCHFGLSEFFFLTQKGVLIVKLKTYLKSKLSSLIME